MFKTILQNELKLWRLMQLEHRKSMDVADQLLADEFTDISPTRGVGDKGKLIDYMSKSNRTVELCNFVTKNLSNDIILATFTTNKILSSTASIKVFRSSIWKIVANDWKLFFHQGTADSLTKTITPGFIDQRSKSTKINNKIIVSHRDTKQKISLAPQQTKCLALLVQGYTSKEIAKHLNLSYRTVDHYSARLRKVLGCRNIKELIVSYSNLQLEV